MKNGLHLKISIPKHQVCEMIYRRTRRRLIESFELHSVSRLSDILAVLIAVSDGLSIFH